MYHHKVKKSDFICYLYPITDKSEAKMHIENIRRQFADARHICYAFQVDNHSGMGDDGEPSGTAGKPMFQSLQHQHLLNSLAIVVRYFGGVKLGAGGLIRAYANAVKITIQQAELIEKIDRSTLRIHAGFALENKIRHFCQQKNISIIDCQYNSRCEITCLIPLNQLIQFKHDLLSLCAGEVEVYVD